MKASHTPYYFIVGAVVVAASLIPIPYLASPKWDVLVVDDASSPIEGMTVRSTYQDYSTETNGHEEDKQTDKNGHTSFQAHQSSASIVRRVMFTLLSARAGVHASFGRHASLFVFGRGRQGSAVSGQYVMDWTGTPTEVKTRITVTRFRDSIQR